MCSSDLIVAEGVPGGAYRVAEQIKNATALDTRVTVLGHVQRGGSPSARDRMVATYMGHEAVKLLSEGKTCRVVAMQGVKDGEVFHQIYRGNSTSEQLYQKISDTLTLLAMGGNR